MLSLSGTSAIPSVMVTELTLSVVPVGMAVVTAGFSHTDGPLSRAVTRAEATFCGLRSDGR